MLSIAMLRTRVVFPLAALLPIACSNTYEADEPTGRPSANALRATNDGEGCSRTLDSDAQLRRAIDDAFAFAAMRLRETVRALMAAYPADYATYYPTHTFISGPQVGQWDFRPASRPQISSRVQDWRSGFFPGALWLVHHEHPRARDLLEFARAWTAGIEAIKDVPIDHDIGFRFRSSFGQALRLTRPADDPSGGYRAHAREVLLEAARTLDTRFDQGGIPVGAIRAEDDYPPAGPYPVYVDSMMNVPLLFEAAQLRGRRSAEARRWYEHGVTHATTVMRDNVRDDGSTYHIARYRDGTFGTPPDGRLYDKISDQGYGNETTWSRGQAWAIYGFALVHRFTRHDPRAETARFLRTAERAADYFLAHLPANDADPFNHREGDFVPPSDFDASRGEPPGPYNDANGDHVYGDRKPPTRAFTERDSSAAAIAARGLLELSELAREPSKRERYRRGARDILRSLLTFRGPDGNLLYLAKDPSPHRGLLANGSVAWGSGTNSLIYGDYYLLEAMSRYRAAAAAAAAHHCDCDCEREGERDDNGDDPP
ncbi:hypothetical protein [Pendulispora albinea]|uniref:Glycoside hydrolase family 88 protein n=1 Tax=Pendulispora albinea TaxID=2741071 RepID=A0ABZ2LZT2_9BACT